MENGTAVGLLIGGAVLILAASPKPQAVNGVPQVAPGGYLNPFNWLSGALRAPAQPTGPGYQQVSPGIPQTSSPAAPYNARQAGYSPAASPAGASPAGYSPSSPYGSPPASPAYQNANYSPYGTALPVASPAAYSPGGAYSPSYGNGGGYQSAAYSPSYSPGGSPVYSA